MWLKRCSSQSKISARVSEAKLVAVQPTPRAQQQSIAGWKASVAVPVLEYFGPGHFSESFLQLCHPWFVSFNILGFIVPRICWLYHAVSTCIHRWRWKWLSTSFMYWLHLRAHDLHGLPQASSFLKVSNPWECSPNSSKLNSISWVLKHRLVNVLFLEFWTSLFQVFLGHDKNPVVGWWDLF